MAITQDRRTALAPTKAMVAARAAQQAWADRTVRERLNAIRRFRRRLAADVEAMMAAMAREGRTTHDSLVAEIVPLADACRFLERAAAGLLKPRRLGARGRPAWLFGVEAEVRREPFGVVLVIAPSNYPLFLPGVQIVQALVAGNAVLVKPAPGCVAPMGLMAGWLSEAGLPPGLLHVLGEDAAEAQTSLAAGVEMVVLTGSAETGRRVAASAAELLVPTVMELSGNDAVFVMPGADITLVAQALAFGLRFNGSATCIAPRRVFVPRDQVDALLTTLRLLVEGTPPAPVPVGMRRHAARLIEDAIASGARPLAGVADADAPEWPPVVLTNARPDMSLLQADVFAPVLGIVAIDDMDEALTLSRESPYALGASVFGPPEEALALAARIDAGSVTINDIIAPTADPRLPFGGRRESGWSVTRGAEGLLQMTQIKTVSLRRRGPRFHLDLPQPGDEALVLAAFRALHGTGPTRRTAFGGLLRAIRARSQREKLREPR